MSCKLEDEGVVFEMELGESRFEELLMSEEGVSGVVCEIGV